MTVDQLQWVGRLLIVAAVICGIPGFLAGRANNHQAAIALFSMASTFCLIALLAFIASVAMALSP